jgi:hypothetical protein
MDDDGNAMPTTVGAEPKSTDTQERPERVNAYLCNHAKSLK